MTNVSQKSTTTTARKVHKDLIHLHSRKMTGLRWLDRRIKPLSECQFQGGGAVEVCYGTLTADRDKLADYMRQLPAALKKGGLQKDECLIAIDSNRNEVAPVWLIQNRGYHD